MNEFLEKLRPALLIINGISLGFATIVVVLLCIIVFLYHDLSKRVTFRIQGMIALLDITRHIGLYVIEMPPNSLCMFFGFLGLFADTLYVLLNVVVAMNAHLIGIKNKIPPKTMYIWLLVGAVTTSFILNFGAYAVGIIGLNKFGQCYIRKDLEYRWVAQLMLVYLPNIPGIIYCMYVSVHLFIKFGRRSKCEEELRKNPDETPRMSYLKSIEFIRKLYLRIALLPLFCTATISFYIAASMMNNFKIPVNVAILLLSRLGLRLAGTFNFIAFISDPYFHIAFRRTIYGKLDDDALLYDVESCDDPRFTSDEKEDPSRDDEYETFKSMNFDKRDLAILGQRKYIKLF